MSSYRYTIFLLFAIHLVLPAFSQPVFSGGELSRTPGYTYSGFSCGPASFPSAGEGLTWSYSSLTCGMENVDMYIVDPAPVSGAFNFPGATAAEQYEGESGGRFFTSSDTAEYYLGYYALPGVNSICTDTRTDIVYPLTYGTTFTDSMVCQESDTYNRTRYGQTTTSCVGYGTLVLPYGTFTDCLLLHRHWSYLDDYEQLGAGYVLGDAYSFFHAGIPVALYTVSYSTYTQGDSTIINHGSSLLDELSTGTLALRSLHDGAVLSPNPTNGEVLLTRNGTGPADMHVLATDGRIVLSERLGSAVRQHHFSLDGLPPGAYTVRITDKDKSSALRVVKE